MTKTLGRRITSELLREMDACEDQVLLFEVWLKGRSYVYITERNIKAALKAG